MEVSAFTQFVDLSVTYEVEHDFGLESTPSTGNNEEVCFNATRNFTVQVANSGPFFHVFEGADFLTIFENETSLFSVCSLLEACYMLAKQCIKSHNSGVPRCSSGVLAASTLRNTITASQQRC